MVTPTRHSSNVNGRTLRMTRSRVASRAQKENTEEDVEQAVQQAASLAQTLHEDGKVETSVHGNNKARKNVNGSDREKVLVKAELEEEEELETSDALSSCTSSTEEEDIDDDSVGAALKTCIEEGDLSSEIFRRMDRKANAYSTDKIVNCASSQPLRQRKSKRQKEKMKRLQRAKRKKNINSFIDQTSLFDLFDSNGDLGGLSELCAAMLALNQDLETPTKSRKRHREKSPRNRSPIATPSKLNKAGRKSEKNMLPQAQGSANKNLSSNLDINNVGQKEDKVVQKRKVKKGKERNPYKSIYSKRLLAIIPRQQGPSIIDATVLIQVNGKRFRRLKKEKVLRPTPIMLRPSLLKDKKKKELKSIKSSINPPDNNKRKVSSTSLVPSRKPRLSKIVPSSPVSTKQHMKNDTNIVSAETPLKLFLKDLQYNDFLQNNCSGYVMDWRRLAQWNVPLRPHCGLKMTNYNSEKSILSEFGELLSCYDASYNLSKKEEYAPKQPSILETPRRRHKDETYARWCNELLNCLSSSGRNMALHEWFYSDVDKGWFNDNPFAKGMRDHVKIPSNAKLTKLEWSLVRKEINRCGIGAHKHSRKRRLFSQRFLRSQLDELLSYHKDARTIQTWNGDVETIAPFGYDVFPAISVGATVTAVNKSAQMIHRGLVLDRTLYNDHIRYHIQFERKELGLEYCSDIKVASHGPPSILLPSEERTLDGINRNNCQGQFPYGTAYGPLINSQKKANQNGTNKSPLSNDKHTTSHLLSNEKRNGAFLGKLGKLHLMEHRAERELLIKLINIHESLISRKSALLEALKDFHESVFEGPYAVEPNDELDILESYEEHYHWLVNNLKETNVSLESSLMHMQVMYGSAYVERTLDEIHPPLAGLRPNDQSEPWSKKWAQNTSEYLDQIGNSIVRELDRETSHNCSIFESGLRENMLLNRVSTATTLLLASNLCSSLASQNEALSTKCVHELLDSSMTQLQSWRAGNPSPTQNSYGELTNAISLLQKELTLW